MGFVRASQQFGEAGTAAVVAAAQQLMQEATAQRQQGGSGWWRRREAGLLALGLTLEDDDGETSANGGCGAAGAVKTAISPRVYLCFATRAVACLRNALMRHTG